MKKRIISCCVMLAMSIPAVAATRTVNPGDSIQAALDYVGSNGGGTVYITQGTYTLGYTANVWNNTTVKGQGTSKPIIKLNTGRNEPVFKNRSVPFSSIKMDYLHVDGQLSSTVMNNGSRKDVVGFAFTDRHSGVYSSGFTIVNCYAERCAMGMEIGRVSNVSVINTTVTNCGSYEPSAPRHGAYIGCCDNMVLDRLHCQNIKVFGIGIKLTDVDSRSENSIMVKGCICTNNTDRGIAAYDENHLYVEGNTCNYNTKSGINLIRCTNGTLKNNTAINNGYQENVAYDIWLNSCSGFTISGNTYGTKRGF